MRVTVVGLFSILLYCVNEYPYQKINTGGCAHSNVYISHNSRFPCSIRFPPDKYTSNIEIIRMDFDFALAVSLQEEHDKERKTKITPVQNSQMNAKGIVDKEWELVDPTPNIHRLFVEYDSMFFGSSLTDNGVAVDWSKRMTL